jgi:hypothetical protein
MIDGKSERIPVMSQHAPALVIARLIQACSGYRDCYGTVPLKSGRPVMTLIV